jgi:hypothetical protein
MESSERDEIEESVASRATSRFGKQIKAAIEGTAPQLKANFQRAFNLKPGGAENVVDYLSPRYGANFGVLQPRTRQYNASFTIAQGKLWKLLALRDAGLHTLFAPETCELVLWHPAKDEVTYAPDDFQRASEALIELQAESDKEGVGFMPVTSAMEAAQRIRALELGIR